MFNIYMANFPGWHTESLSAECSVY